MRFIPPDLAEHLQKSATTTAHIMKIEPVRQGAASYGVTSLDVDIKYDDGDGEVTYLAAVGMDMTEVTASSTLDTDDMEARSLMPVYDVPVSEQDIAAGLYDYAKIKVMLVNYADLSQGHVTLLEGTLGRLTLRDDGTSIAHEVRGLTAMLRQEVCTKYTKTCRAIDGTMPIGSPLPGEQVSRDACGVDFTGYDKSSSVADVGLENTLSFQVADLDEDWETENFFVPGRVTFTSGRNAGRTLEIMGSTTDGWITLRHEAGYPIQYDDEIEYRRGCSFIARDEEKGCKAHAGNKWINHFKGYPDIPTENAMQSMMPGASIGPGRGGGEMPPAGETE